MKRSIVLSLILAICCLLPFTASAEEWSDFFALNEETAIGYDEALASYQDTPNALAGTRIELLPSAAILSGDAVLAREAIITGDGESTAVWTVDVPVTGLYELEITYFAQDGNEAKVQRRLTSTASCRMRKRTTSAYTAALWSGRAKSAARTPSTMKCGRGRMKSTSGRPSARRMGRACMLTRSNSA